MSAAAAPIALFGGGRWGRVLFGVIDRVAPPSRPLLWVSPTQADALRALMARHATVRRVDVLEHADEALSAMPATGVVATAPATHAALARRLLEAGADVLVEKPFTLDLADARALVALAAAGGRRLWVDHEFMVAPFVQAFAARQRLRDVAAVDVHWEDPPEEWRHGQRKRPDLTTPLAWDVFPHLWSLWQVLAAPAPAVPQSVAVADDGSLTLHFESHGVAFGGRLGRRGAARTRCLRVTDAAGIDETLDFSTEPGTLTRGDGRAEPFAPLEGEPPLERVLRGFLGAGGDESLAAAHCLGSVAGAAAVQAEVTRIGVARLFGLAAAGGSVTPALERLLVDNLLPVLARHDPGLAYRLGDDSPAWLEPARVALAAVAAGPELPPEVVLERVAERVLSA